MMKARSSLGRNFIEVCKCAGWGDIGYVNRWTMEITNNSRFYSIPLVVGRRIAQIVFFDSAGTIGSRSYADTGKYQKSEDMKEIMVSVVLCVRALSVSDPSFAVFLCVMD